MLLEWARIDKGDDDLASGDARQRQPLAQSKPDACLGDRRARPQASLVSWRVRKESATLLREGSRRLHSSSRC